MKKILFAIFVLVVCICACAQPKAPNVNSNTAKISGAENAIQSASGKYVAVQFDSTFLLLETQNFNESIGNLKKRDGKFIGFLPSDTLVYSAGGEIFALEAEKQTVRKLFPANLAANLIEPTGHQKDVVIVSNDLIISGSGSYDWGGDMGNIFRYDLKTNRMTKGAKVWAFWYASLSPGGKYILYEHGAEASNVADIYDVSLDKNYTVSQYFNFKREFPKLKETDEVPIAWLHGQERFIAEVTPQGDYENRETWLVLLDVPAKRIIWKKLVNKEMFPTDFQQISDDIALLAYYEDGVYELSLKTGEMRKNPAIEAEAITAGPDGKQIAFIKSNQVFTASSDGSNKKLILDLPPDWKPQDAYKGMKTRAPMWLKGGNWLLIFGENELLTVRL